MAKFCTNCGSAIEPGVKFCPSCGQTQSTEQQAPPTQQPEPTTWQTQPLEPSVPQTAQPQPAEPAPTAWQPPQPVEPPQPQPAQTAQPEPPPWQPPELWQQPPVPQPAQPIEPTPVPQPAQPQPIESVPPTQPATWQQSQTTPTPEPPPPPAPTVPTPPPPPQPSAPPPPPPQQPPQQQWQQNVAPPAAKSKGKFPVIPVVIIGAIVVLAAAVFVILYATGYLGSKNKGTTVSDADKTPQVSESAPTDTGTSSILPDPDASTDAPETESPTATDDETDVSPEPTESEPAPTETEPEPTETEPEPEPYPDYSGMIGFAISSDYAAETVPFNTIAEAVRSQAINFNYDVIINDDGSVNCIISPEAYEEMLTFMETDILDYLNMLIEDDDLYPLIWYIEYTTDYSEIDFYLSDDINLLDDDESEIYAIAMADLAEYITVYRVFYYQGAEKSTLFTLYDYNTGDEYDHINVPANY